MMMKPFLFLLLAAAAHGAAQAQPLSAAIELSGEGPYYRLALPLAIHGLTAQGDLRDVRVVNAAGHAVPRAWLRDEAVASRVSMQDAPIFALPRRESAADDAAVLTVRPDGSLAFSARTPPPADADAAQWIIDASRVQGSLLQARFALVPEARGVFAFKLEASDDLRQWRRVGGEEQLARLTQGGQTIERLAVDLGHLRARFLRLTWADARYAAPLSAVGIDSIEEFEPVAPLEWLPPIPPGRCAADQCDYPLPRGVPVQSLRIDLPDLNTLAQVSVSGLRDESHAAAQPMPVPLNPLYALRHRRQASAAAAANEIPLLDTVVYRLAQGDREARSPVIALDGRPYARLRLRTRGPVSALGATPPSIAVAGVPRTLVFLAQGQGPFSLRWDAAADVGAPMALATLIPGYTAAQPLRAGQAAVALPGAADADVATPPGVDPMGAAKPERRWWLWGALGAGLLLLAGMAWSLFGSLRRGRAESGME
jgi:hypothetical protein